MQNPTRTTAPFGPASRQSPTATAVPPSPGMPGRPPVPTQAPPIRDPRDATSAGPPPNVGAAVVEGEFTRGLNTTITAAAAALPAGELRDLLIAQALKEMATAQQLDKSWDGYQKTYPDRDYARNREDFLKANKEQYAGLERAQDNLRALIPKTPTSTRTESQTKLDDANAAYKNAQTAQLGTVRGYKETVDPVTGERTKILDADGNPIPITGYTNAQWASGEASAHANALAEMRLRFDQDIKKDQTLMADRVQRYTEAHNEQLRLDKAAETARREEKDAKDREERRWQTDYLGANDQYKEESATARAQYQGDVSQRSQDVSAVGNQQAALTRMGEALLPNMIPIAQLNALNAGMRSPIAGTPTGGVTPTTLYNNVRDVPQQAWGGLVPPPVGGITMPQRNAPPYPDVLGYGAGGGVPDPSMYGGYQQLLNNPYTSPTNAPMTMPPAMSPEDFAALYVEPPPEEK